jgi:hypothetical protein
MGSYASFSGRGPAVERLGDPCLPIASVQQAVASAHYPPSAMIATVMMAYLVCLAHLKE